MPFVNIRLIKEALKDNPDKKKEEIGRRVTEAICDVAGLPKDAVWVVFEDIRPSEWQVGGRTVERIWRDQKK